MHNSNSSCGSISCIANNHPRSMLHPLWRMLKPEPHHCRWRAALRTLWTQWRSAFWARVITRRAGYHRRSSRLEVAKLISPLHRIERYRFRSLPQAPTMDNAFLLILRPSIMHDSKGRTELPMGTWPCIAIKQDHAFPSCMSSNGNVADSEGGRVQSVPSTRNSGEGKEKTHNDAHL